MSAGEPSALVRGIRVTAATARNGRQRNEDAIAIGGWLLLADTAGPVEVSVPVGDGGFTVVALADGLGGHPDGDRAARIGARHLTDLAAFGSGGKLALVQAFQRADDAILEAGGGMGCTAAAVVIRHDGWCAAGNLGDVRLYQVIDGYPGQLTVDDRAPALPAQAPAGLVTDHLGAARRGIARPHVHEFRALPDDRLLLCSDGLHDVVPVETIRQCLGMEAGRAVEVLLRCALERGATDNITVLLVDIPCLP